MAESNSERQFKKDVLRAKEKYRKKRRVIILSILVVSLLTLIISNFIYYKQSKKLEASLKEQETKIAELDKTHQVNDVLISKLNDPQFITDLVRQEYGLSYEGEIIFNLPLQDKFMQTAIKAISEGNIQKIEDSKLKIDDKKLQELKKQEQEKNKKDSSKDNSNSTNEDNSNSDKKSSQTEDKENKNKDEN